MYIIILADSLNNDTNAQSNSSENARDKDFSYIPNNSSGSLNQPEVNHENFCSN